MTYRIIGNMTGNSMDAIDLVLTEFNGDKMTDICTFSRPYTKNMQEKMEYLRQNVRAKRRSEILNIADFADIHDEYIKDIALAIEDMLKAHNIDKKTITAIGFHGKTLDHNPPSVAKSSGLPPYTLQMGSGQLLADITGIDVVYDFRSAYVINGFDGAPLVAPHNAHISTTEGDGCYFNGGNTSNFAWVIEGRAEVAADAGPFNEYVDNFIRQYSEYLYDKDGKYGLKGSLDSKLLHYLYDTGRQYYELPLPKSGDPQYYHKDAIFAEIAKNKSAINPDSKEFCNVVHTLEYFAAYIAVQALTLTAKSIKLPHEIILFGGGWKNPVVRQSFEKLLSGEGYVLPEHQEAFNTLVARFGSKPKIRYSDFGEYMEARLFADMARYRLENKVWETPEVVNTGKHIISGVIATPSKETREYTDKLNLASFGWQDKL